MNIPRSMIEAGARALANHNVLRKWDQLNDEWRDEYRKAATATIRAAIGCDKIGHVYIKMPATLTLAIGNEVGSTWKLNNGDTILIVRAEKGGGNG